MRKRREGSNDLSSFLTFDFFLIPDPRAASGPGTLPD